MKKVVVMVVLGVILANVSLAEIIRDGIDIDFVTIGNAGNSPDSTGYGAVDYNYQIGKYEITNAQWNQFTATVGAPTGNPISLYEQDAYWTGDNVPTNRVTWNEAAQFCNYLTSGDKSKGAYLFSGDNANPGDFLGIDRDLAVSTYGTAFFIPTEDEWYKAAYYKPDGSGYSLYANGLDTLPPADNGWNYDLGAYYDPWDVGSGLEEQNGTYDMMGNVWEWNETLVLSNRGVRGGSYLDPATSLNSSYRYETDGVYNGGSEVGFRIATIPEPSTISLLVVGAMAIFRKRK